MKGIFFNLAQDVVEDRWGVEVWDDTLERAGVDGAYTWFGTYPDADLFAIVRALSESVGLPTGGVLVAIGRGGFPSLAARHAEVLAGIDDWRSLVARLDDVVHPEAEMLHPGARPPRFDDLGSDDLGRVPGGPIRLRYESDRALCALAHGLFFGVGDWFGTPLRVEHVRCVHHGDATCVMEVGEA